MVHLAAEELDPLLPHLVEIIVGLIAFVLLVFVVLRAMRPTLDKNHETAVSKIRGGLERAESEQAEASALKQRYADKLAGSRAETARIRDDARVEGQQITAELRTEAEEEAARIRARAEEQVTALREAATRSLRAEVGGRSAQLAERILADELADPARRSATVDSVLAELGSLAPRTGGAG